MPLTTGYKINRYSVVVIENCKLSLEFILCFEKSWADALSISQKKNKYAVKINFVYSYVNVTILTRIIFHVRTLVFLIILTGVEHG